jgi:acetate kinase
MIILVINTGSSSLKYQLLEMEHETVLAAGMVERIGEPNARVKHQGHPGQDREYTLNLEQAVADHTEGLHLAIDLIVDGDHGVLQDIGEIDAVGHRVVQGGESFSRTTRIDDRVITAVRNCNPLAPLHNPANLVGIEVAGQLLPGIPQAAVFDTEFHQTMPPAAYLYPLPYRYYEKMGIRRYGFHGTSHKYVFRQAAAEMGQAPGDTSAITLHLGNGCSMAAVKNGACVDTSMGMTPLAGLMMGTRCGDIDPAIIFHLAEEKGIALAEISKILNGESGLKGICDNYDMRDIRRQAAEGDQMAALALEMFAYRIKKYIGAYCAVLGRVDTLVFTAGIGENDCQARADICQGLEGLGIEIDLKANRVLADCHGPIHKKDSRVQIRVIPTNEELQIARETAAVLSNE